MNLESFALPITIKAQLVESELGEYKTYIFKNLDTNEYLNITRYPNWEGCLPEIGEIGYLTYNIVIGGLTKYFKEDSETKFVLYNTTHLGFIKFILERDKFNNNNKIFKIT